MSPKERIGYACIGGILLFAFGYVGAQHLRKPAPIVFQAGPPRVSNFQHSRAKESAAPPSGTPADQPATDGMVVVDVAGAVKTPGVVHLSPDARVVDAIHAAGGAKDDADLSEVNLAAKLVDGTQLRVPAKGSSSGSKVAVNGEHHARSGGSVPPMPIDKSGYFAPVAVAPEYQPNAAGPDPASPDTKTAAHRSGKKAVSEVDVNTAGVEELQSLPGVGPAIAQKILDYRQQNGPFKSVDELSAVKGIGPKKLEKMRPYVRL